MKTEMLAVYILVAALVIVPYIAIIVFGSGKGKKLNRRFKEEVKAKGLNISEKESWNRHTIGVDKEKQTLVFSQYNEDNSVSTAIINLNELVGVDIFQKNNVIKVDNKRSEVLDSSGLNLQLLHDQRQEIRFYDTRVDVAQNYEREHAEKWRTLLLSFKKPKNSLKGTVAA
jgi:hypothetical protein